MDAKALKPQSNPGSNPSVRWVQRLKIRFLRSRFFRALRNNPFSLLGIIIAVVFLIFALFPEQFTVYDPVKLNLQARLLPPSLEHWFGTDSVGMDVYTRVVYGARITLMVVIVVLAIATSIGYLVGSKLRFLVMPDNIGCWRWFGRPVYCSNQGLTSTPCNSR